MMFKLVNGKVPTHLSKNAKLDKYSWRMIKPNENNKLVLRMDAEKESPHF